MEHAFKKSLNPLKNVHKTIVKWTCPPVGWCKLNSDGAFVSSTGMTSGRGLIRDCNGVWVSSFACNIGPSSIEETEIYMMVEGLKLASSKGCRRLIVRTDFTVVKELTESNAKGSSSLKNLLLSCKDFLARPWETSLRISILKRME